MFDRCNVSLKAEKNPAVQPAGFRLSNLLLMFMFLGPVNYLVDSNWLSGDSNKQALRDKSAQTYVVRMGTAPVGRAKVVYCQHFLFREIKAGDRIAPSPLHLSGSETA